MVTSQLDFIPTGFHNVTRPMQFAIETNYGEVEDSTSFAACPLTIDIGESMNQMGEKVSGDGRYTFWRHAFLGDRYTLDTKHVITSVDFLNLCTKHPNYTSPTDNLASSLSLVRSHKQSLGDYTLNDVYMGYLGCRAKSVSFSISQESKIELNIGWSIREMLGPVASLGFVTPTFVNDFSGDRVDGSDTFT